MWNLSRNARVCLGFRPPRGQALVHGEEGSLRIREEKALEFNNFFSRFTKENGKYIFLFFTKPCLGLPRSARASDALGRTLRSMARREGRLGLGPQKSFKVPAPCVCNLSRNARVCLGFRLPRGMALVSGGGLGLGPDLFV